MNNKLAWNLKDMASEFGVDVKTMKKFLSLSDAPKPAYELGIIKYWSSDRIRDWWTNRQAREIQRDYNVDSTADTRLNEMVNVASQNQIT